MEDDFGGSRLQRGLRRVMGAKPVLWESHAVGERLLVEELEQLRGEGYQLFHDRRLEPGSREIVDTIVVGPPGVFLFDAKHWWGRVLVENNKLVQERRYRRERTGDIDKLLFAAKRVGQITHTYIHPFLILTGEARMDGGSFISKVRVRSVEGTAGLLRTQIQTLSDDDIGRISALVDANFPHRDVQPEAGPFSARPADPGAAGAPAQARSLLPAVPSLSAAGATAAGLIRRNREPADPMRPSPPPLGYYLRHPFSAASRSSTPPEPADSTMQFVPQDDWSAPREARRWRWRPRRRTIALLLVLLALLLLLVANPFSFRPGLTGCSLVGDDAATAVMGHEVEGSRRLTGGCAFAVAGAKGDPELLVWQGAAAQRRADGIKAVSVRREDCGVLVVAPENTRLTGVTESVAERAVAAAVCFRDGSTATKAVRLKAIATAGPLLSAIRKDAVADNN